MNTVIKILTEDDGTPIENGKWHLEVIICGDPQLLCTGEYYFENDAKYEEKHVRRGGITCQECISKIKEMKAIKL